MRSCIILFMYNLRIRYQLNNNISSILIIFSFYLLIMPFVSSLWLTLRNNSLAGFEIISSHLGKLENLDLSYNIFKDNILSHLRGLSSLKSLNLSGNMLLGSTTINGKVVNISWHLLLFTSFLNNTFWNL
jgi:hypothetical protein